MRPAKARLADLNSELIETYSAVRDDWKAVWTKLRAHQIEHLRDPETYYYKIRQSRLKSDFAKAARFIYLNRSCWNGLYRVNLRGEFNVPKGTKNSILLPDDDFPSVANRLADVELTASDFAETLANCGRGDFVFVDPPYTANHNWNGFLKYNERIFSWEDQLRLAESVEGAVSRGAAVLITNAAHASVRKLYESIGEIHTVTRYSVLASDSARRSRVEELAIIAGYQNSISQTKLL
jgi:DNA adenine methylase